MTQEMVHNKSTSPDRSATFAKLITVKITEMKELTIFIL